MKSKSQTRKDELISELAWARAEASRRWRETRDDLDLVAHLKHSVTHQKTAWLSGAAIAGWVLAVLPGRRRKASQKTGKTLASSAAKDALPGSPEAADTALNTVRRTGLLLTAFHFLFPILKPALTTALNTFVSQKLRHWNSQNDWSRPFR